MGSTSPLLNQCAGYQRKPYSSSTTTTLSDEVIGGNISWISASSHSRWNSHRGSRRSERSLDSLKAGLHVAQVGFYSTLTTWQLNMISIILLNLFRRHRQRPRFHFSASFSSVCLPTKDTGWPVDRPTQLICILDFYSIWKSLRLINDTKWPIKSHNTLHLMDLN